MYRLLIGKGKTEQYLLSNMANRHGLIAGATGTGKTVSLQVMAENFSSIGVPVFMADVKGDLSGIGEAGCLTEKIGEYLKILNIENFQFSSNPVRFWDVFGRSGHPLRATISDMGPILLSRILDLNEVQSSVLSLVFKIADDEGLLLLDLKDLRALLQYVGENSDKFTLRYGHISQATIGAIQRAILVLEEQGAGHFFGEPSLNLAHLLQTDENGRGIINILSAEKLINLPKMYGAVLLWILSELFENLPEVGDPEKPRIVFFFDEAHLLFTDAPRVLLEKIEQVVRLIRSKGVGVYFITQSPLDIPEKVLNQLGNRIQHALRAFTPKDQKVVRAVAQTFRANPEIDPEKMICELRVGEALVSFLDESGQPSPVERARILPPRSKIGPMSEEMREKLIKQSPLFGIYEKAVDRESAYEILLKRMSQSHAPEIKEEKIPPVSYEKRKGKRRETVIESMAKSAARSIGRELGRQIFRGILGSILRR